MPNSSALDSTEVKILAAFFVVLLGIPLALFFAVNETYVYIYQYELSFLAVVLMLVTFGFLMSGVLLHPGTTTSYLPTESEGTAEPQDEGTTEEGTTEPQQEELEETSGEEEDGTEDGTDDDGKKKKKKLKKPGTCDLTFYWEFKEMTLAASVGEEKNPTGVPMAVEHHSIVRKPAGTPIPMSAVSEDIHVLVHGCGCAGTLDQKMYELYALVAFDWEISEGGGKFVGITGGPGSNTAVGDQVIYSPPDIDTGKSADVKILVKALHADVSKPPFHGPIIQGINMTITRADDEYVYEWWPVNIARMSNVFNVALPKGDCNANRKWWQLLPIQGFISATLWDRSVSDVPLERQTGECSPGDYVRIEFKGEDRDYLQLNCTPGGKCKFPSSKSLNLIDELRCSWSATKGEFVKTVSLHSTVAVWHAPMEEGAVDISVQVNDSLTQFVDRQLDIGTKIMVKRKA